MEACRFGQKEKEKVKKLFKQNENYFELSDPVKDIAYNSVRVTKAAFRSFYVSSYVCVALGKKKTTETTETSLQHTVFRKP